PRHLSGREGSASEAARNYGVHLARAAAPVPVRLVDERMSTVLAHRAMRESGRSGRRHRAVVDQAAAVAILQSALDQERATGMRAGEQVDVDGGGAEQREASR
ncbi:MAG TPA: RuvX/YqgF family protein, partial [Actinotalea sp.]|nr:RuvX/YqgF family protein [Actinotalea sp.]